MSWPWSKRAAAERRGAAFAGAFAALHHPPITRREQADAMARIDVSSSQWRIIDMGAGPIRVNVGTVDIADLRPAYGYALVLEGYDRFGWPKGHPDSPATEVPA